MGGGQISDALLDAWRIAVRRSVLGEPWADIHAKFALEVAAAPATARTARCNLALASMSLAARREALIPNVSPDSSYADLIAALPKARLDAYTALTPYETNARGEYFWDLMIVRNRNADHDPAILLYRRGRDAIPDLLGALADGTASRTGAVSPRAAYPLLFCANDVAFAVIEAIGHCSFRSGEGSDSLISEWSTEQRQQVADSIAQWLSATEGMSPAQAVIWRIEHQNVPAAYSLLQGLIRRGEADAVGDFLRTRYRKGDDIDINYANLFIQTGSRAPLETVARQAAQGARHTPNKLRLIVQNGERIDFERLREYVAALGAGGDPLQVKDVVDALRERPNPLGLPVLMAALEVELALHAANLAEIDRAGLPLYMDDTAQEVQKITGIGFGHRTQDAVPRRLRAIREMLNWWQREGQSAYAYNFNEPSAAGGIR